MITFDNPAVLLLALPVIAFAVYTWRTGYANMSVRRGRIALGIRIALLCAVVLALAGAGLSLPQSREVVTFVADLSASDARNADAMRGLINSALAHRGTDSRAAVVTVGRQAQVEQPPAPLDRINAFETSVDPNYTNLEGGLELAGALLPDGYRHRVVVATDGRQNVGDALATARLLHSLGVRLDVAPVRTQSGPEVLVDNVTIPSQLRPREDFSLEVTIRSTIETTAQLSVVRDRTLVLAHKETIHPGSSSFSFAQSPLKPGFHSYSVHINPAVDTQVQNNRGSAFTIVQGPPHVLVISANRTEAANIMASLLTTGLHADLQSPGDVIPTLAYLQRYVAVVLVDTAADVLPPGLIDQFVPYVRDLGHGLVVIGGRETYGMGGYGQTPLEDALPVKMDLPKRKNLPSAAVVLVIENLEAQTDVNISKQAGKGVINLLTQQDQVGVTDAQGGHFAVPLQHVVNKRGIDTAIDAMSPGDPMSYSADLQAAYDALRNTHARVKHIILLGDGDAEDPGYQPLATKIRAGGVTISTVATNGLGFNDFQTMENIARWGGGRYYRGDQTSSIPNIFLREARTVARSGIVEGKFYPRELSSNPMLRDIISVPPLDGYVATTPKPTGEMVLVSKKLDPVLAGWQLGLGRSVAWTSDAAGLWTRQWLQAPGANRFWANLVSWTLPSVLGGQLFVNTTSSGGLGHVSVNTPAVVGADPAVEAHILGPDLRSLSVALQPTAPGRYSGSFQSNAEGPYFVTVDAHGDGHAAAGQAGLNVPYSAEYRATGTDMAFLHELAAAGGGSMLSTPSAAWADNLQAVYARHGIGLWLWVFALLLLPVDIGVRRLVVGRRDLAAIWQAVTFRAPRASTNEPAVAPLGAIRAGRQGRKTPRREEVREPVASAIPSVRLPRKKPAQPAVSTPRSAGQPQAANGKSAAAAPRPAGDSTSSRLLDAKNRRK